MIESAPGQRPAETSVRIAAAAVLFDLDDTLVDFTGAAGRALADATAHVRAARRQPVAVAVAAWHDVNDEIYGRFLTGALAFDEMRVARMAAVLERLDPGGSWDPVAVEEQRNQAIFDHYTLFADVADLLDRCRAADVPIGIISNSDGDYQRRKLAAVGLAHLSEVAVFSGDLGVSKPDPTIFAAGAARLDVAPDQAVYVGDRWFTDVVGAARAGMPSVWLNRAGALRPAEPVAHEDGPMSGPVPDLVLGEIASLVELELVASDG